MTYYADTAFNSTAPRTLPPVPDNPTRLQRSAKKYTLHGKGTACREFIAIEDMMIIDLLNHPTEEDKRDLAHPLHETFYWASIKNPVTKLTMLRNAAAWLGFFGFLGGTVIGAIGMFVAVDPDFNSIYWPTLISIALLFYILYKIPSTIINKGWVTSKHNTAFHRRTGMVTFTWKGQRVSYPFDEFDIAVQHVAGYSAELTYYPVLIHRYTGQFCRAGHSFWKIWEAEQDWECLQQFMDVSQPLPDIPRLEPFRHRDPLTAQWDQQHHRPSHYWRNMSLDHANALRKKAQHAAQTFPWGLSYDVAIATGWQPSGVGQGDWLQKNKQDA